MRRSDHIGSASIMRDHVRVEIDGREASRESLSPVSNLALGTVRLVHVGPGAGRRSGTNERLVSTTSGQVEIRKLAMGPHKWSSATGTGF
jgi:hypothetical protein